MAIWEKLFSKITFKDYPDTSTPLNATNLNKMTDAIDGIDNRVVELNSNLIQTNSNFVVEEITLTMKNGWTAGTTQKAFKMGKLIYILVDVIAPTNITRNQDIFTLPEGMALYYGTVTRVQLRQYSNNTDAPFIRTVMWNNGVFATDNNNDSGAVANATYQGQIIALLR